MLLDNKKEFMTDEISTSTHTKFDGEILCPSEISCVTYLHKQLQLEDSQTMMFHTQHL